MKQQQKEPRTQVRFPIEVWEDIKRLAAAHQRSLNGEVIWALRYYIAAQKGDKPREKSLEVPLVSYQEARTNALLDIDQVQGDV